MRSRCVLITGGTGFVGSHLTRLVIEQGADVHLLVRPGTSTWRIADVLARATVWFGDLVDPIVVARCVQQVQPEIVFHLAADTSTRRMDLRLDALIRSVEVNLIGTLNLLRATAQSSGRGVRVVRAGGLEEYGAGPIPFDESQRERPVSPYSASQVATAHYAQMLQYYTDTEVVTLRPALIYGPAQEPSFFIPSLIVRALQEQPFTQKSTGAQSRDLLYVQDVVDAFIRAAQAHSIAGRIINLGTGGEYAMNDVAGLIRRLTGSTANTQLIATCERHIDLAHLRCRTDCARDLLEWVPTVDLENGIDRTIAWYRERLNNAEGYT